MEAGASAAAAQTLANKTHRPKQSGAKVDKRKASKRKDDAEKAAESGAAPAAPHKSNKAFGVAKFGRLHKSMQRKQDLGHRKDHAPLVDRTTATPPPLLVVVMGPPGSGKSTLIKVCDAAGKTTGAARELLVIEDSYAVSFAARRLGP